MNERRAHRINSDVTILPAKDPTKCGYSVDLGGIYICSMESTPCQRCAVCALTTCDNLVNTFADCINAPTEYKILGVDKNEQVYEIEPVNDK